MRTTVKLKDGIGYGCNNVIHKGLGTLTGVFGVSVDVGDGTVTVDHTDEVTARQIEDKLTGMGYRIEEAPRPNPPRCEGNVCKLG